MPEPELSQKIASYIQNRANARIEKFDKEDEKQRKDAEEEETDAAQKRSEITASFQPAVWLGDAANRAKQISMVTHALKFTHTDAKGSSIYYQPTNNDLNDASYLSTATLKEIRADVVGNAAALDVAGLLQLTDEQQVSLLNRIEQGDTSALAFFANDADQLEEWVNGFKSVLTDKELSSHKQAKQLYIPLPPGEYHLVAPLYASSLAQTLYQRIGDSRYSDHAKALRKARKEEKYSDAETVDYPNIAVQNFGGTKPQNVSQLNSGRGGKSFLLSCQPPIWQKQEAPPSGSKHAFWSGYEQRVWKVAKEFKKYLTHIYEKSSTKPRRDRRAELVDDLIGALFQYAAEVRNMTAYSGWSARSALPLAEQLWLDPFRNDEEFQRLRETNDWQQDIAGSFASWLNRKLESDKLVMKDVEYREWFREVMDRFKNDLEGFSS